MRWDLTFIPPPSFSPNTKESLFKNNFKNKYKSGCFLRSPDLASQLVLVMCSSVSFRSRAAGAAAWAKKLQLLFLYLPPQLVWGNPEMFPGVLADISSGSWVLPGASSQRDKPWALLPWGVQGTCGAGVQATYSGEMFGQVNGIDGWGSGHLGERGLPQTGEVADGTLLQNGSHLPVDMRVVVVQPGEPQNERQVRLVVKLQGQKGAWLLIASGGWWFRGCDHPAPGQEWGHASGLAPGSVVRPAPGWWDCPPHHSKGRWWW